MAKKKGKEERKKEKKRKEITGKWGHGRPLGLDNVVVEQPGFA